MMKQVPPERPLPHKQAILDRVLQDEVPSARERTRLMPLAAAAAIAAVIGGALTLPSLRQDHGVDPAAQAASSNQGLQNTEEPSNGVSTYAGRLTPAQANQFAATCVRFVGAKVGTILHPTLVRTRSGGLDWSVVVKSGSKTYGCVGPSHGKAGDVSFVTFPAPDKRRTQLGVDTGGGASDRPKGPDDLSNGMWVVAGRGVTTVQQRFVLEGKSGPWFTTPVIDGLAYVHSWAKTASVDGQKIVVQTRQLDRDGEQVGVTDVRQLRFEPLHSEGTKSTAGR
jgi:hypothetical protein